MRLAAVAVVLVALLGAGALLSRESLGDDIARETTGDRVRLLQPAPGAVAESATVLAWGAVPGASGYEVELFAAEGRRVLATRTVDTTLALAAGLVPGEYRWGVMARLAGGDSVRGALRVLRVVPRR